MPTESNNTQKYLEMPRSFFLNPTNSFRFAGIGLILLAAGITLVQHWESTSDIDRFASMAALSALLPILTYLTGIRLGDIRTARMIIVGTPAILLCNTALLSGMLTGSVGNLSGLSTAWIVDHPIYAFVAIGMTILASGFSLHAFRILFVPESRIFPALMLLQFFLVLLPLRGSIAMVIALGAAIGIATQGAAHIVEQGRGRTYAVSWLWAVPTFLFGRQLYMGYCDALYLAGILVLAPYILDTLQKMLRRTSEMSWGHQLFGSTLRATGIVLVYGSFANQTRIFPDFASFMACGSILIFVLAGFYRRHLLLADTLLLTGVSQMMFVEWQYASLLYWFCALAMNVGVFAWGWRYKSHKLNVVTVMFSLFLVGDNVRFVFRTYSYAGWVSLALAGTVILLGVAIYEARRTRLIKRAM